MNTILLQNTLASDTINQIVVEEKTLSIMQHVKDLKLCLPSNYRNEFNLEFLVSLLFNSNKSGGD